MVLGPKYRPLPPVAAPVSPSMYESAHPGRHRTDQSLPDVGRPSPAGELGRPADRAGGTSLVQRPPDR